jgi:hypothetical protein
LSLTPAADACGATICSATIGSSSGGCAGVVGISTRRLPNFGSRIHGAGLVACANSAPNMT